MKNNNKLIVSIYDYSGNWPADYINAGYAVILWDYKKEGCILQHFDRLYGMILEAVEAGYQPYGLFCAPPCTDVSAAGAQYWSAKDIAPAPEDYAPWSQTEYASSLIEICLHLKELFNWSFWVLENPPGRLEALVPEFKPFRQMMFNPYEYGDNMTKRTVLWGDFNTDLIKAPIKPHTVKIKTRNRFYSSNPIWAQTGGKTDKTKELRSNTPKKFARAFFNANQ